MAPGMTRSLGSSLLSSPPPSTMVPPKYPVDPLLRPASVAGRDGCAADVKLFIFDSAPVPNS